MAAIQAAPSVGPIELRRMTPRQVAAKLRGGFASGYWTVVQHRRDARAADAPIIFVIDHDALMKKSGPAPSMRDRAVQVGSRDLLDARRVYLRTAPGESPPLVEAPVPLSEVGPPALPLGLPEPALPEPIVLPAPLVGAFKLPPLLPAAPGVFPPLVEAPVPLNEVAPPAVPLGLPCANADMPDNANAVANAIVVNFMAVSFRW